MSDDKCPFCGAEMQTDNRRNAGQGPLSMRYKCRSEISSYQNAQDGSWDEKEWQSSECKLTVRHRRIMEIVDRMIEAEKVRTARNYCGHACPLSEQMIELINDRKAVQDE